MFKTINNIVLISLLILDICKVTISSRIIFGTPSQSDTCTTAEGTNGLCVEISRCPSVKNNIVFRPPKHCGFKGKMPIVCCPLTEIISHIRSHDEVAAPKANFECGTRVIKSGRKRLGRKKQQTTDQLSTNDKPFGGNLQTFLNNHLNLWILGGKIAIRNSWPWMVLLWRPRGPEKRFFCGGTLINPRFVITAAHCVLSLAPFSARLGEHDHTSLRIRNFTIITDTRQDVEVKDVFFHPDYDIDFGYYDIALLELAKDVTIKEEVRPICLPWGKEVKKNLVDEVVTMAGWGKDAFGSLGSASPYLVEVNLTVFKTEVCRLSYSELPGYSKTFPNGMAAHNILCAGDVEGGKDTCQGDSGGPLMLHRHSTNTFSLVGVISKGNGCGDKKFPGLNAPVANIDTLQWIKDTAFSKFAL